MKLIDLHCDTISRILNESEKGKPVNLLSNDLQIDINKMRKGDYLLQCFAMFLPLKLTPKPFERCLQLIDCFDSQMKINKDYIRPIRTYHDIINNRKEGIMSALLTVEDSGMTMGNINNLYTMYERGVRLVTLTWNYDNGIGYPNFKYDSEHHRIYDYPCDKGLTPYGIQMVKEMNRLGMIVDVSHLSDGGFYDVAKYSTKPFVASHSNARAKCWFPRNLTDDMIRVISNKRGVIGINFCKDFLVDNPNEEMIPSIVKHIKHIRDIGGIECLAFGTDFDGIEPTSDIKDASEMPKLYSALKSEGFSEDDLEKIFYKNALRLFKECLPGE